MFDPALKPVGLYVEQGRELVHVNTTSGYGNFHMKPNGIFYISGDRAAVVETRAFLKHRPKADLASQSGPMLVINGRLHPRFDRSSRSLKARTGVGVRADGEVVFAISIILHGGCCKCPNGTLVRQFLWTTFAAISSRAKFACAIKAFRVAGLAGRGPAAAAGGWLKSEDQPPAK
jgi:hypothetical protein